MALTDAFFITDNTVQRAAMDADAEAIARVRAGETDAFEPIMRRHNQRLFRIARSILHDDDDAQDALHERLYRKLDMAAPRAFEFAGARCDRVTAAVMQRLHGGV